MLTTFHTIGVETPVTNLRISFSDVGSLSFLFYTLRVGTRLALTTLFFLGPTGTYIEHTHTRVSGRTFLLGNTRSTGQRPLPLTKTSSYTWIRPSLFGFTYNGSVVRCLSDLVFRYFLFPLASLHRIPKRLFEL